jgi:hypothetical protein
MEARDGEDYRAGSNWVLPGLYLSSVGTTVSFLSHMF